MRTDSHYRRHVFVRVDAVLQFLGAFQVAGSRLGCGFLRIIKGFVALVVCNPAVIEMSNMALAPGYDTDEDEELEVKRLTPQEAQRLRESDPPLSPWRVLGMQCVAALLMVLVAWGVSGKPSVMWSVAYGAVAVIAPAALFARGVMSQFSSLNAATATFGFFVWEAVKMGVSVVMIYAAPRLIPDLSWLALLVGLFVTLKMYWLALLMRPKSKQI